MITIKDSVAIRAPCSKLVHHTPLYENKAV